MSPHLQEYRNPQSGLANRPQGHPLWSTIIYSESNCEEAPRGQSVRPRTSEQSWRELITSISYLSG